MKLKFDFVTNSSSSSFIIWGNSIFKEDLIRNEKFMMTLYNYVNPISKDKPRISFDEWKDTLGDEFDDYIGDLGKSVNADVNIGGGEEYLIGLHPDKMRGDETKDQFFKKIENMLENIGLEPNPIILIEDVIYDY